MNLNFVFWGQVEKYCSQDLKKHTLSETSRAVPHLLQSVDKSMRMLLQVRGGALVRAYCSFRSVFGSDCSQTSSKPLLFISDLTGREAEDKPAIFSSECRGEVHSTENETRVQKNQKEGSSHVFQGSERDDSLQVLADEESSRALAELGASWNWERPL